MDTLGPGNSWLTTFFVRAVARLSLDRTCFHHLMLGQRNFKGALETNSGSSYSPLSSIIRQVPAPCTGGKFRLRLLFQWIVSPILHGNFGTLRLG